ncbi:MAG TPA: DUF4265 domain-containing protein [Thermoanaerobaculia bacterium]
MTADEPEKLAKIVVDLPNHWAAAGEGLWARDLGDGSYEIRNIPFHAYGLNLGDIVEASAERPDLKPVVRRVVRSGGHRTLRVRFEKTVPEQTRLMLLRKRNRHKASFERGTDTYFAIDIEPDGDYDAVCKQLEIWLEKNLLAYETCEPRSEGRFDEGPS